MKHPTTKACSVTRMMTAFIMIIFYQLLLVVVVVRLLDPVGVSGGGGGVSAQPVTSASSSRTRSQQQQQQESPPQQQQHQKRIFPYLYATYDDVNASFPVIEHIAPMYNNNNMNQNNYNNNDNNNNNNNNDNTKDKIQDRPDFLYSHNNSHYRIVEFYVHWCDVCKNFKKHYIQFAKQLHHEVKLVSTTTTTTSSANLNNQTNNSSSDNKNSSSHVIEEKEELQQQLSVDVYAVSCTPNRQICKDHTNGIFPIIRFLEPYDVVGIDIVHTDLHVRTILDKMGIHSSSITTDLREEDKDDDVSNVDDTNKQQQTSWYRSIIFVDHITSILQNALPFNNSKWINSNNNKNTKATTVASMNKKKNQNHHQQQYQQRRYNLIHDTLLSFEFAMRHSVYITTSSTSIGSEQRIDALKEWLKLCKNTIPSSWTYLHELVIDLYDNFDYVVQSEEYLYSVLDNTMISYIQERRRQQQNNNNHNKYYNIDEEMIWSIDCNHGDVNNGYTCGLWELLHVVTIGVVDYNRYTIHQQQQMNITNAAVTIRNYIDHFFSCNECRLNFISSFDNCHYNRCQRFVFHDTSSTTATLTTTTNMIHPSSPPLLMDDNNNNNDRGNDNNNNNNNNNNNKNMILLQHWIELPLWLHETHNGVNVRLFKERLVRENGNKTFIIPATDEEMARWPSEYDCNNKCWYNRTIHLIHKMNMYKYLKVMYGEYDEVLTMYRNELFSTNAVRDTVTNSNSHIESMHNNNSNNNNDKNNPKLSWWMKQILAILRIGSDDNDNIMKATDSTATVDLVMGTNNTNKDHNSNNDTTTVNPKTTTTTTTTTLDNNADSIFELFHHPDHVQRDAYVSLVYTLHYHLFEQHNIDDDDDDDDNSDYKHSNTINSNMVIVPSERKMVLYRFLKLLRKTVPPTWYPMRQLIKKLLEEYDVVTSNKDEMIKVLDSINTIGITNNITSSTLLSWSDTCTKKQHIIQSNHRTVGGVDWKDHQQQHPFSSTTYSSYLCGIWTLFHTISVGVVEYNQRAPIFHRLSIYDVIVIEWNEFIIHLVGNCTECIQLFQTNILAYNSDCGNEACQKFNKRIQQHQEDNNDNDVLTTMNVDEEEEEETILDWIQLPLWLHHIHNRINQRLLLNERENENSHSNYSMHNQSIVWPSRRICPICYKDDDEESGVNVEQPQQKQQIEDDNNGSNDNASKITTLSSVTSTELALYKFLKLVYGRQDDETIDFRIQLRNSYNDMLRNGAEETNETTTVATTAIDAASIVSETLEEETPFTTTTTKQSLTKTLQVHQQNSIAKKSTVHDQFIQVATIVAIYIATIAAAMMTTNMIHIVTIGFMR